MLRAAEHGTSECEQNAKEALTEGVMAARIAARILGVMSDEKAIVKICWMCM